MGSELKNEYTAKELAGVFGCTQQTIINRCKKGDFRGAVKRKSPYGEQWFIPKEAISNFAQEIVPVLKVQQEVTLKDFENIFKVSLRPLLEAQEKILEDNQRILEDNQKLQERVDELSKKIESMESRDHEILTQIRAIQEGKKTFWERLFGKGKKDFEP